MREVSAMHVDQQIAECRSGFQFLLKVVQGRNKFRPAGALLEARDDKQSVAACKHAMGQQRWQWQFIFKGLLDALSHT